LRGYEPITRSFSGFPPWNPSIRAIRCRLSLLWAKPLEGALPS